MVAASSSSCRPRPKPWRLRQQRAAFTAAVAAAAVVVAVLPVQVAAAVTSASAVLSDAALAQEVVTGGSSGGTGGGQGAGSGYGAGRPPVGESSAQSLLRRWLRSLEIKLPGLNASVPGYTVSLYGGLCSGIDLTSIHTSREGKGLRIEAGGVAAACRLDYAARNARSHALDFSGEVSAWLNQSSLGGVLMLTSDGGEPPLPSGLEAPRESCGGRFVVSRLDFEGGAVSKVLELLRGPIRRYLTASVAAAVCGKVDALLNRQGAEAVQRGGAALRRFLDSAAHSPPAPRRLPGPREDYVDLERSTVVRFLSRLVDGVIGNSSSPHSLQQLAMRLLGPSGNLSLNASGIVAEFRVPGVGAVHLGPQELRFGGLVSTSSLRLGAEAPQRAGMALALAELSAGAAVDLRVDLDVGPDSPLHGRALIEHFDLDLAVQQLRSGAALFLAANGRELKALAVDQLGELACLAPALKPEPLLTGLDLRLDAPARISLEPRGTSKGDLEADVDVMLTMMVDSVLSDFAPAVSALLDHAVSVNLRDAVNDKVSSALSTAGACPDAASIFADLGLSAAAFAGATGLAVAIILALLLLPLRGALLACLGAKRRRAAAPNSAGAVGVVAVVGCAGAEDGGQAAAPWQPPWPAEAVPVSAAATAADALDVPLAATAECQVSQDGWALFQHPRIPLALRTCLPVWVVVTVLLFLASNSGVGCNVRLSVTVDGEEAAELPPVFAFSLLGSVHHMWQGKVYALAILIAAFSGIWPYAKLLLMLLCWFAPARRLSVRARQRLLDFLDAYGKWSLVDTFVLVMFMVAFRFELSGLGARSPFVAGMFRELGSDARFVVYIEATPAFYFFLLATFLSLVVGHAMTACHRFALRIGEYAIEEPSSVPDGASVRELRGRWRGAGSRRRLCDVLRSPGRREGAVSKWGPCAAVTVAFLLTVVGVFADTFQFRFLGLAGYVLGPEAALRPFSVVGLDLALPGSSEAPDSLGVRTIQGTFLFFAALVMPLFLSLLLCLWCAPLTLKGQRALLVACQVLNAWNGLDVFCLSILASALEIRRFALFIVGDHCDLINEFIARLPLASELEGSATCFDLRSELRPGFYLLALASFLSAAAGHFTLGRCSRALLSSSSSSSAQDAEHDGDGGTSTSAAVATGDGGGFSSA